MSQNNKGEIMKKLKYLVLVLILIPCFLISGCALFQTDPYIISIEKGETYGSTTCYILTYSDGTTSTLNIEDKTDGSDGATWITGTAIDGTGNDINCLILNSKVNDLYLNIETYNVYKCTDINTWQHIGNIKGIDGSNGKDGEDLTLDVIQAYCNNAGITLEEYFESLNIEFNNNTIENAVNTALKSTVSIIAISPNAANSIYYSRAGGSGVIYSMGSTYSYIVTNYHVVSTKTTESKIATKIKLFQYGADMSISASDKYTTDGTNYYYTEYYFSDTAVDATYIGGSDTYDIAVLQVKTADLLAVNPHACAVTIANEYSVANTAIAIGNPNAAGMSVTKGIISVESEYLELEGITYRVMRIDTAVNPGNSGGGLFDINGELIGIVNAKMESATIDNIAYALPYDNITKVANNIIDNYSGSAVEVKKLYLGLTFNTENSHAVYDSTTNTTKLYDEFVVDEIDSGSVAENIGIKVGDNITSVIIDGVTYNITRAYQVPELMLYVRVGSNIKFIGTRNGVENTNLAYCDNILAEYLISVK